MSDYAHKETDKLIKSVEKKIRSDYWNANRACKQKLKDHLDKFAEKDARMLGKVNAGEMTMNDYTKWRAGQMLTGQRWQDMCDTLAKDFTNTDLIARSTIMGHMPEAYALNRNFGRFEISAQTGIDTSFTLFDKRTVERLWRDNPKLMPKPSLKTGKALQWNNRKVRSAITRGVLSGQSIPDIANTLDTVMNSGYSAAVRAARTSMTSAQNAGRIDSYKEAEEMGIEMEQMWVATLDDRTRESHVLMDGETVPVGEEFSNGCKFPADPDCPDPAEVYNCRCTMIAQIKGFERDATDLDLRHDERLSGKSYEEWKNRQTEAPAPMDVLKTPYTGSSDDNYNKLSVSLKTGRLNTIHAMC